MLDALLGAVIEGLIGLLLWLILWPVALIVSTPFVVVNALFAALSHKQRFFCAMADGYSSVTAFWKNWVD